MEKERRRRGGGYADGWDGWKRSRSRQWPHAEMDVQQQPSRIQSDVADRAHHPAAPSGTRAGVNRLTPPTRCRWLKLFPLWQENSTDSAKTTKKERCWM